MEKNRQDDQQCDVTCSENEIGNQNMQEETYKNRIIKRVRSKIWTEKNKWKKTEGRIKPIV